MKEDIRFGRHTVLEALDNKEVHQLYFSGPPKGTLKKILGKARDLGVPIREVSPKKLDELAEGENHQGICAYVSSFQYGDWEEFLADLPENPFLVILDGIEDPHNLGALIRSAYQAGACGVVIPKRRSASVNGTVAKTSAGAISGIPVFRVNNLSQEVESLKARGFWVYGADMGEAPFWTTDLTGSVAVVLGSEGKGLSPGLKKHMDGILSIPMVGSLDSINVSCAGSILFFEVLRQRHEG